MPREMMGFVAGALAVLSILPAPAQAKPRFFFEVRGVQTPAGAGAALKDQASKLILRELKQQPEVVTDLGEPRPRGADLERTLKLRGLQGYGLVLRVVKHSHSLQPPAPGKVYKLLMVEVAVAIDAEKIPSGQMALAGEGSAQVGTEVSKVKDKEREQLLQEALTEAIQQAVKKSIAKLGTPEPSKKKGRRARKKR